MENNETISTDDLQILREVVSAQAIATSNKVFVEGFLTRKYNLQNGDSLDIIAGKISRGSENGSGEIVP